MQRPLVSHWAITSILVAAVALRLYGVGWGLPHVYEEAKPLKVAWQMWGWGPDDSLDLNPHFFNYPSLSLYLQFGTQAVLYGAMRAVGDVQSTEDFRVRYHSNPTPFYTLGRSINILFAAFTVLVLYRMGRRLGVGYRTGNGEGAGRWITWIAPFLLAVNLFHVSRSQMVEVDVPLTFFVVVAVASTLALIDAPTKKRYAIAGIAVGLAAGTKYTAALLVFPLLTAHLIARRSSADRRPAGHGLLLAGVLVAATFAATSPFVIADPAAFWRDFAAERSHMRLGHFGVGAQPAWQYYPSALASRLAGWPVLVLALTGLVHSLAFRREAWSAVVLSWVAPYTLAISSWAMMADRYALVLLPFLFLYAAAGLRALVPLVPGARWWRTVVAAAALAAAVSPVALALPRHLERFESDSRTECLEWLDRNVAGGSFVVSEAYGPPLAGPVQYWRWPGDIRDRIYRAVTSGGRPFLSYFEIPMFQVEWDQSAAFYDLRLYEEADVLIATGAVRSRHANDPARFERQVAFYRRIGSVFDEVARIDPSGSGPSMVIYRRRPARPPFSKRRVGAPPPLQPPGPLRPHWYGTYYYRMAVNYEAWNHMPQAIAGYQMALPYAEGDSEVYRDVVYGVIRCLTLTGQRERALAFIDGVRSRAPTVEDQRFVDRLRGGVMEYDR